ncbi:hypothetical protein INS49_005939 [Diaporthe citri]|uniref:uncharacterized protein n=1 Tax=Diaporthe citri TaxID=83186 RepID=UPI001C8104D4|nr:uncharacterized protein INS49_005939 [Diaporthe citri]KAG6364338.1 hypothetical protein INS49_005939 [Diaporthe citri]
MEKNTLGAGGSHNLRDGQYQYEPLIAEDAVRILVLEAADDFESPLRCSIIQRGRDSQSRSASGCEYSAVSYTWGDCELSHQLFVRHDAQSWHCLHITASVDSLLRHLRVSYKPKLLWIDAICLNQKDETEKTQQIPLMGRLYSDAKRVHIWLGDTEVEEAARAFAIFRSIEREQEPKFDEAERMCLAEFFTRPWFKRRWIIQEAVFSHDAIFRRGSHTLSLSRVMLVLRKTYGVGDDALMAYGSRMLLSSDGLANMLRRRDQAADKPWRDMSSYMKEIDKVVQAHRVNPAALSAAHEMVIQDISSSLRHAAILEIQTMAGSYWATGPPNSRVGDWVVPMMFRGASQFVPIMCLRPINLTKAEEPRQIPSTTDMNQRCLRFFSSGSIAEVGCLHVIARFVGPASRDKERRYTLGTGADNEIMLDIIMRANEVARGKGLPGPIVFDIV